MLDIRSRLGLPKLDPGPQARLVVVDAQGRILALLVDSISQIARLPSSCVNPPPADALEKRIHERLPSSAQ